MGFGHDSYRDAIINRIHRIEDDPLTFEEPVFHLGEIAVVMINSNPRQLGPVLLHCKCHPVLAATKQCRARDSKHIFAGPAIHRISGSHRDALQKTRNVC